MAKSALPTAAFGHCGESAARCVGSAVAARLSAHGARVYRPDRRPTKERSEGGRGRSAQHQLDPRASLGRSSAACAPPAPVGFHRPLAPVNSADRHRSQKHVLASARNHTSKPRPSARVSPNCGPVFISRLRDPAKFRQWPVSASPYANPIRI